jgi:hypothetical protein
MSSEDVAAIVRELKNAHKAAFDELYAKKIKQRQRLIHGCLEHLEQQLPNSYKSSVSLRTGLGAPTRDARECSVSAEFDDARAPTTTGGETAADCGRIAHLRDELNRIYSSTAEEGDDVPLPPVVAPAPSDEEQRKRELIEAIKKAYARDV